MVLSTLAEGDETVPDTSTNPLIEKDKEIKGTNGDKDRNGAKEENKKDDKNQDGDGDDTAIQLIDIDSARRKVKLLFAHTKLGIERELCFPRFAYEELRLGKVLGQGGFGTVSEIRSIHPKKEFCNSGSFSFRSWADITGQVGGGGVGGGGGGVVGGGGRVQLQDQQQQQQQQTSEEEEEEEPYVPEFDPDYDESEFQSKKYIADYCTGRNGDARYVIKAITPDVKKDARKFIRAATDFAIETQFLSVLDHPHIIKLRAVGLGDMLDPDYFLVLDRLYGTLDDRIEQWVEDLKWSKSCWGKLRGGKTLKKALFRERLCGAKNLASALEHLHGLDIIYRDLKPENIGFDIKDTIKLFDFGLAKELNPDRANAVGTYMLTPCTGSWRYMAPEIMNRSPYNLAADVYSFGLLLWEILTLKIPYQGYNAAMFKEMVANFGDRPKINESWSSGIKDLIKSCWDGRLGRRPPFTDVVTALDGEISRLGNV